MDEEKQEIEETIRMCEYNLKLARFRHNIAWFLTFILIMCVAYFILAGITISFFNILAIFGVMLMVYWNIKYHNYLVLDIEDLKFILEELNNKEE